MKALAKKIGAKVLGCCLEDTECANMLLRDIALETVREYNRSLRAGCRGIDVPSRPVVLLR